MEPWQEALTQVDRVRARTSDAVLSDADDELRARLQLYRDADDGVVSRRLAELDREWDIERVLILNASTLAGMGVLGGIAKRQVLAFPLVVLGFLFQHGLQGWCPPLTIFRRRGVRTRREIDVERYALKVLRGDFGPPASRDIDQVLEQAVRH